MFHQQLLKSFLLLLAQCILMSNHLAYISNENYLTMKVNLPKDNGFQKKTPILTLIDDESTCRLTKANAVSFDLKVDPEKDNSPTFKTMVRVLEGNETIRQLPRWRQDVDKVLKALKAKEVAEQLSVLSALMRPSPAAMFNAELGKLSAIRFNAAFAAAAAEDLARKDNRDTRERAVNALGRDHYRHEDDIPVALQRMMTSLLPRQVHLAW